MPLGVTHTELPGEKQRIESLMGLVPDGLRTALDAGTADCHIATLLARSFESVTAIDLEEPVSPDPRIATARGDVTSLDYPDDAFDLVVCSEVLEHVAPRWVPKACEELSRVAARFVLIAVPYNQDIRLGRTRCAACGKRNAPYGHVNTFTEDTLRQLFGRLAPVRTVFVGQGGRKTNFLSAWLMDAAGNPYGTYRQQQPCMHCGERLVAPGQLSAARKAAARAALSLNRLQAAFRRPQPNWIQMLFAKRAGQAP